MPLLSQHYCYILHELGLPLVQMQNTHDQRGAMNYVMDLTANGD